MIAPREGFAARMRRLIRAHGPISVAQFMAEANAHYYAHADPLGAAGDFVTAPEISQMFGEMIGGWIGDLANRATVDDFAYVELGPGRGTLAADALRVLDAAGIVPAVHLVEASPVLRAAQAVTVPTAKFHDSVDTLPEDRPLLVVANEFFDALPVRQLVRTANGWRERMVGLDADRLVPVAGSVPMDAAVAARFSDAGEGAIVETNPAASAIMTDLAVRVSAQGGAILVIDYGSAEKRTGSSLQAVRDHARADPFADAGDADLTAHVDFAALADAARQAGCAVHGLAAQGNWLRQLGILQRAAVLARAGGTAAAQVQSAVLRLTGPQAMGSLFKVLACGAPDWPAGAGFAER